MPTCAPMGDAVLRAIDIVVEFPIGRTGLIVSAVAGISLDVMRGETLGVVGESGCGKTSMARAVMQLPPPTAGAVWFNGRDLTGLDAKSVRAARTGVQMIFQDPIAALNPRRNLREAVREPLAIWNRGDEAEQWAVVDRLLDEVGIDPARAAESRPHEFSGGQCQRVAIARALVLDPSLVICDEPVSSLDVSVQAQVLNLLEDLKARHDLSLLFIAHDLAVVKNVSDRVAVMYLGKLCEVASSELLFAEPAHPYTKVLIDSIPVADPAVPPMPPQVSGEPPSAVFAKGSEPPGVASRRAVRGRPRCASRLNHSSPPSPTRRRPRCRLPSPADPCRRHLRRDTPLIPSATMTLTDPTTLDAVQQKAIRLNLGWYRIGRSDPTTWLGPADFVRAVVTPDGPATLRLSWHTPGRGLVVETWGAGADWAAAAAPGMTALGKPIASASRRSSPRHEGRSPPPRFRRRGQWRPLSRPVANDHRAANHGPRGGSPVGSAHLPARREGSGTVSRPALAAAARTTRWDADVVVPSVGHRSQASSHARRRRPPRPSAVGVGDARRRRRV